MENCYAYEFHNAKTVFFSALLYYFSPHSILSLASSAVGSWLLIKLINFSRKGRTILRATFLWLLVESQQTGDIAERRRLVFLHNLVSHNLPHQLSKIGPTVF